VGEALRIDANCGRFTLLLAGGIMIQIRNSLLNAAVILFLSCCGPSRDVPETKLPETPKIENTLSLALIPVADGGLYAVDKVAGVVWYVSNGKAVRISSLKAEFVNEIVPAAEGGAYLYITEGSTGALWYLKGPTATKIEEDTSLVEFKEKPRLAESWLWAMWQTERLRKQKVKDEERG
jgi:hypothetical protein